MNNKKLVVIATGNAGKIKEFSHGMGTDLYDFRILQEVGFNEEIIENGTSFAANAEIKARAVASWLAARGLSAMILADDSGLEVEALGGAPGIYTARYAGVHGDDRKNYEKLLNELDGELNRRARFVCALCVIENNGEPRIFEGECRGTIGFAPVGAKGFGYDPVFIPEGYSRTFAEMELSEKKSMSHRGNAIKKMMVEIG
jgi:XTP/dITP diphosphohydrolase